MLTEPGRGQEPDERAEQALDHRVAGRQRVAAQHAERAEGDPEGVGHVAGQRRWRWRCARAMPVRGSPSRTRTASGRQLGTCAAWSARVTNSSRASGSPTGSTIGTARRPRPGRASRRCRRPATARRRRSPATGNARSRRAATSRGLSSRRRAGGADLRLQRVDAAAGGEPGRCRRRPVRRPQGVCRTPRSSAALDRSSSASPASSGAATPRQAGEVEDPRRVVDRPHDGPVAAARAHRAAGRERQAAAASAPAPSRPRAAESATPSAPTPSPSASSRSASASHVVASAALIRRRSWAGQSSDAGERRGEPADHPAQQPIGQRAPVRRQGDGEHERQRQRRAARHRVAAEQPGEAGRGRPTMAMPIAASDDPRAAMTVPSAISPAHSAVITR